MIPAFRPSRNQAARDVVSSHVGVESRSIKKLDRTRVEDPRTPARRPTMFSAPPKTLAPPRLSAEGASLKTEYLASYNQTVRLVEKGKQFGSALASFKQLRNCAERCRQHFDEAGARGVTPGAQSEDPDFVGKMLEFDFFKLLWRAKCNWNQELMQSSDLRKRLRVGKLDSWAAFDEQVCAGRERLGLMAEEEGSDSSDLPQQGARPGEFFLGSSALGAQMRAGKCGFLRAEVAADLARARELAGELYAEDPNRLAPMFDVLGAEADAAQRAGELSIFIEKLRQRVDMCEAVVLRDELPTAADLELLISAAGEDHSSGQCSRQQDRITTPSPDATLLVPYGTPKATEDIDPARGVTYSGRGPNMMQLMQAKAQWGLSDCVRHELGYLRWRHLVKAYHALATHLGRAEKQTRREAEFLADKAWKCQQKFSFVFDAFALAKDVELNKRLRGAPGKKNSRMRGQQLSPQAEKMAAELVQDFASSVEKGDVTIARELRLFSQTAFMYATRCFQRATRLQTGAGAFELAVLPRGPIRRGAIPEWRPSDSTAEEVFLCGQANLEIALLAARTAKDWAQERVCVLSRLGYLDDRGSVEDLTRVLPTHRTDFNLELRGGKLFENEFCPICGEDVFTSVDDKRRLSLVRGRATGAGAILGKGWKCWCVEQYYHARPCARPYQDFARPCARQHPSLERYENRRDSDVQSLQQR